MTKASDNLFPGIILNEAATDGSDFSNPAADYRRLFLGEDGNLHLKDSAGSVTQVGGGTAFDPDTMLPWHIQLIPMVATPDATTGTWALANSTDSAQNFGFYVPGSVANSGGAAAWNNAGTNAQNDACAWDVILAAGTWDAHFWVRKSTNTAIITLNQDGSSMGTVDTYAAAVAAAKVSITGWTVSTTGKKRMQIKAATRNASNSTGWVIQVYAIEFRRTA